MSKSNSNDTPSKAEDIGLVGQTPLHIHKQYLKDMSFENPNAPGIFNKIEQRPVMDMNISLDVQKLEHEEHEFYYEVSLKLNASATQGNTAMFIADVVYAAAVSLHGVEEKHHHPLLFIEVPQLIFPFARQILANATHAGAFMPLQLSPVDFKAMYLKRFAQNDADKNESTKSSEDTA